MIGPAIACLILLGYYIFGLVYVACRLINEFVMDIYEYNSLTKIMLSLLIIIIWVPISLIPLAIVAAIGSIVLAIVYLLFIAMFLF